MALVRWDPFRELTSLQSQVNRMFSRLGDGEAAERQSWTPSVDVIETDDEIKLKAELAGMKPEDIKIEVQDNVLTVSGERHFEEEVKEDKYYRIERRYGSFSRSIALPQTADEGRIEARSPRLSRRRQPKYDRRQRTGGISGRLLTAAAGPLCGDRRQIAAGRHDNKRETIDDH